MVGEIHGTKEPAEFVSSLVDLFINNGNTVQVGLEIPSEEVNNFALDTADHNIYSSTFFKTKRNDNRASSAWASLINKFKNIPNVDFFYYDVNAGDFKNYSDRDSLMYTKIKKRIQLHPTWKTITLSGNVHNMLLPYYGEIKMGLYLYNDTDLNLSNGILSLAHVYAFGTLLDDSGKIAKV